jgi:hypothetical protein
MKEARLWTVSVSLVVSTALLTGCSSNNPPLGKVSGKVTLDNEPLSGVIINFKPDEGRAATATTDAQGNYNLEFSYGVMGAKVGRNTVMLEWPLGEGEPGTGGPQKALPKKYTGLNSELIVEVKKGRNTHNFDLSSK